MKIKASWIIVALLILIIIYLLQCRGNGKKDDTPQPPEIKSVPEQKIVILKDSLDTKRVLDSMQHIQNGLVTQVSKTTTALFNEQDRTLQLQQTNDELLSQLKASELTTDILAQNEKIKANDRKKDSLCNAVTSNLKKQLSIKSNVITEKDKLNAKLKKSLDTCFKNQSSLEKYAKDIKPRNKVSIGATAGFNPSNNEFAYGLAVQYSLKNGYSIQASALQMKNSQMYAATILKTISFRRK